jgi:hypothetical protein
MSSNRTFGMNDMTILRNIEDAVILLSLEMKLDTE